ncbi:helix-turn-helix domain-containing protein [Roseovarius sp. C03]|uniref:helix-turn-helix domain-containing protein n=1 Tax=Roseovarius sp. C03 TaxID=3449222 RepID=UPI003EDBB6B5
MTAPRHAADPGATFSSHADFYQNSAYAAFPQEHRAGGSLGITVFRVEQEPIDFIDAPNDDLVFCRADTDGREILIDLGDGPIISDHKASTLTVYPAQTPPRTRVVDNHVATLITLPVKRLRILDEGTLFSSDGSLFGRYLGRMEAPPLSANRLMDRMWGVLENPTSIDHLLFDGLTLQFLAEMANAGGLSPLGGARPEDQRIARIIDYIEAHFGDQLNIDELAGVACLSPAHFSRVFKATVGVPVWSYVQQRRCVRAKEMLIGTRMPLIEVAFRCGFSSQSHFTRAISKHFGVTPGQIRDAGR